MGSMVVISGSPRCSDAIRLKTKPAGELRPRRDRARRRLDVREEDDDTPGDSGDDKRREEVQKKRKEVAELATILIGLRWCGDGEFRRRTEGSRR
jgi:hypothetical protein